MEEYPRNLTEFEALFATEEACREYLGRLRWPDGFRCPRCGGGKSWPVRVVLVKYLEVVKEIRNWRPLLNLRFAEMDMAL